MGLLSAEAVSSMPDHPNAWTDGSLVLDRVTGVSSDQVLGSLLTRSEECWRVVGGVYCC